jgi:hypothetical protein
MSLKTEVTMTCDKAGCKNSVVAASRKLVKKEARSKGWLVKGAKTMLCQTHRPAVAVAAKKTSKKATKAVKGKKGKSAPTKKQGLVSRAVRGVVSFSSTPDAGSDKPN